MTEANKPTTNDQPTNQELDHVTFAIEGINAAWRAFYTAMGNRFGDDEETLSFIHQTSSVLRESMIGMSYNGTLFMDYFNHYIVKGNGVVELPVMFMLEDFQFGFNNHNTAIPAYARNINGPGSDDPRWTYDALPTKRLFETTDPGSVRIAIRGETTGYILYGFLELFVQEKKVGEEVVKLVTEIPAIRVKDNYIPPNAVWRWYEVDEDRVAAEWKAGNSIVKK